MHPVQGLFSDCFPKKKHWGRSGRRFEAVYVRPPESTEVVVTPKVDQSKAYSIAASSQGNASAEVANGCNCDYPTTAFFNPVRPAVSGK